MVPTLTTIQTTGEFESPCEPAHLSPRDDRQWTFLKWSPDGSSLIFDFGSEQAIWQVGSDGSYGRRIAKPRPYSDWAPYGFHADLSPDGRRLVYSTCEYEKGPESRPRTEWPLRVYELAVINMDGGEPERLTEGAAADHYPAWHPDGSRVAYVSTEGSGHIHYAYTFGGPSVWVMSVDHDGRGPRIRRIPRIPNPAQRAPVWSPGGEHIAVVAAEGSPPVGEAWSVYVADVSENSASASSAVVGQTSISPSWSPGGTQLVFAVNRGEKGEEKATVRIVNRDGTGAVELPETKGLVSHVAWHPDGSEILVAEAGEGGLWTVSPDGQTVRDVFLPDSGRYYPWGWAYGGLAWSPDGSRFAVRTLSHGTAGAGGFVLATAAREGDGWRILAMGDADNEWGFRLCNIPGQGPGYPSYEDIEKHCEPAGEQGP